ncbi:MAG: adenine nucleotide alpha hydrolase [Crocinitomicaceae bacterium]|nr:adenine nucleotide alpha hydrolase [Crocinitomicaceae bacterium]|tara:strand:+ start:17314 stop:18480 length:1167 start_codon:yes stop_codon:yes gene_type:complete
MKGYISSKVLENKKTIVCSRCILDNTVSEISFDENGVCSFCVKHDKLLKYYPQEDGKREEKFKNLIYKIKNSGKGKYDVIVGVSGGVDSSFTLHKAVEAGLKPLAVYFDNGWGAEIAVKNIQKITKKLNVDLFTFVVDWEEFKDIQRAFLKASVPCIDIPTDLAISSVLYKAAAKENIKYILSGASFITEGTVPKSWSFIDGAYLRNVYKLYGSKKIKKYPLIDLKSIFYYTFIKKIIQIPFTNYFNYDKKEAKKFLKNNYEWEDYGGHHYENIYSKWGFGWYTYNKFGFDKRKVSLSGPIRMGKMKKSEALKEISSPPAVKKEITAFVMKKLEINNEEFKKIMEQKCRSYKDFKTGLDALNKFKFIVKIAVKKGLISPVVYEKFFDE